LAAILGTRSRTFKLTYVVEEAIERYLGLCHSPSIPWASASRAIFD
jgi:hypothetical protein